MDIAHNAVTRRSRCLIIMSTHTRPHTMPLRLLSHAVPPVPQIALSHYIIFRPSRVDNDQLIIYLFIYSFEMKTDVFDRAVHHSKFIMI